MKIKSLYEFNKFLEKSCKKGKIVVGINEESGQARLAGRDYLGFIYTETAETIKDLLWYSI